MCCFYLIYIFVNWVYVFVYDYCYCYLRFYEVLWLCVCVGWFGFYG